jgi:signal transduction histidine kinase/DNA-binding response OmpR family regulator
MSDREGKVSILVVDDKPEKLLSLEAVLEDLGQNIVRAYSGREALRHVLNQEFAVILLDVNMPDMDGFETAGLIRQRRQSAHVPIIFLTAMSDEMHVARGYSLGAVDYILTPVVPQVLRSKVAVFVDLFRKTQQVQLQAERLRQRATQLHRLTGASLAINSASGVEKITQIATETAREVIDTHTAITIASPGHHHHAHAASYASYSPKYAFWRNVTPQLPEHGMHLLVCGTNKAMRMTHTELDAHSPAPPPGGADPQSIPPLRGMLAAPLTGRDGRNMGLVLLSDKVDGEFNDDDEAVLVQLAQMASVAIENTIFAEEREANRLKDEFLSTLSHELRTPLNAISGWVQLLRLDSNCASAAAAPGNGDNGASNGEVAHGLEVIERNVKAQTKLIEDLLDLSRISTGKLRLTATKIMLKPVVEAAVEALRPAIEEKGITLICRIDDDAADACVSGDPDRLQQVFWNLLSNATKFTPAKGEITARLHRENGTARVSVSDTGDGIDPGFLPHVFDRFRQADSSSSRRHGGLGIGLTIVRHIIELHGGSVSADSAGKGRGSTFSVTLPLLDAHHVDAVCTEHDTSSSSASSAAASGRAAGQDNRAEALLPTALEGIRVLLVDDEPDAREVVADILDRFGASTTTAGSAPEALKLIATVKPQIVVSDIAMPDHDGFWLLRELRRLPPDQGGHIPAIALTAYARPEDRSHAIESGFHAHLAKPIDPNDLVGTVHRVIQQHATLSKLGIVLDPVSSRVGVGA